MQKPAVADTVQLAKRLSDKAFEDKITQILAMKSRHLIGQALLVLQPK